LFEEEGFRHPTRADSHVICDGTEENNSHHEKACRLAR
jgi:hypothetical protein